MAGFADRPAPAPHPLAAHGQADGRSHVVRSCVKLEREASSCCTVTSTSSHTQTHTHTCSGRVVVRRSLCILLRQNQVVALHAGAFHFGEGRCLQDAQRSVEVPRSVTTCNATIPGSRCVQAIVAAMRSVVFTLALLMLLLYATWQFPTKQCLGGS